MAPEQELDFHPAPVRQLIVVLEGTMRLVCGDGAARDFGPGDLVVVDDLTGQGHVLRVLSGGTRSLCLGLPSPGPLVETRSR